MKWEHISDLQIHCSDAQLMRWQNHLTVLLDFATPGCLGDEHGALAGVSSEAPFAHRQIHRAAD
jgi:hypothetical protein